MPKLTAVDIFAATLASHRFYILLFLLTLIIIIIIHTVVSIMGLAGFTYGGFTQHRFYHVVVGKIMVSNVFLLSNCD